MFDNIGGKIKTLAKAQFGIGVVAFCIAGISVMSVGNVLLGILTIGLGLLGSWIGSFFTYGLGELIETTKELNQNMVQLRNDISEVQRFSKEKESKASVSVPTPKVISKREPQSLFLSLRLFCCLLMLRREIYTYPSVYHDRLNDYPQAKQSLSEF